MLYYGAKVRLVLRPEDDSLLPPRLGSALALSSYPRTSSRFAPKSKRQLVAFVACDEAQPPAPESLWTVLPAEGSTADSLRLAGESVPLGARIALRHAATGQCLSCEAPACTVSTAWAAREGEIAAWTHNAPSGMGRTAAMERFSHGAADHEVANLRLAPPNVWRLCASDAAREEEAPAGSEATDE